MAKKAKNTKNTKNTRKTERTDVYERVTNQIVEQLEAGVRPWVRPWNAEHAAGRIPMPLRHDRKTPYQGINVLMLWMAAAENGYEARVWMTYKQAQSLGGQVRKGEKSQLVVYASTFSKEEVNESGEQSREEIPFMKGYAVFNAHQIDGLAEHYYASPSEPLEPMPRDARAESFFQSVGATIRHGGNRAYYSAGIDAVQMPPFEAFDSPEAYYATLAHECTHWTKHPSRLDRDFGRKRWGDEGYAMEELVAELGAAFLCAELELTPEVRDDHAAYLDSWLQVLKQDKRAIFSAAAHAQRSTNYLVERAT